MIASQGIYSQALLTTERREIRILALAPGTGDDVLRGDLIVESLDYDDLHYTALSYTWSGPVSESAILVGGVPLHITENLESALRRLRGSTRVKNVWVDAICINQNDYEDKNVQVSLMGQIYASATRTVVWLGESSAESDVAMEYIDSLRHRASNRPSGDSNVDQLPLQDIVDLMQRKWWTRIWVVQEALMSRRVIVACGQKEVDMVYFVRLVQKSGIKAPFLLRDEPERLQLPQEQPFVDSALKAMYEQHKTSSEQPFLNILSNWYVYKQQAETCGSSLMELTLLMHSFHASVQRDKIFALLGLATPEARSWITPDYSDAISHRLFLIRLTAYFLRFSSLPLRLACLCGVSDYPSWVPDWTNLNSRVVTLLENDRKNPMKYMEKDPEQLPPPEDETAKFNPRLEPPIQSLTRYQEPSALLVHGFLVDRVKIAISIPGIDDGTGDGSQTGTLSFKAKIREWESRMFEHFEVKQIGKGKIPNQSQRLMTATSLQGWRGAKRGRDLKSSLIIYLVHHQDLMSAKMERAQYSRQLRMFRQRFVGNDDEAKKLINHFEEWMQSPARDARGSGKETPRGYFNFHARVSRSSDPGTSKKLGQKLLELNADKTLFLTEHDYHYVEEFAVREGDIICSLWHCSAYYILRKADGENWTLVGRFSPKANYFGAIDWVFRDLAKTKRNMVFRLK